jgi:hypothetical protein
MALQSLMLCLGLAGGFFGDGSVCDQHSSLERYLEDEDWHNDILA